MNLWLWFCAPVFLRAWSGAQVKLRARKIGRVEVNLSSSVLTIQLFISIWEKSYEGIYHSPPHISAITENILITTIRFVRHHLLASNSSFMTDSQYTGTIQIWQNLNEQTPLLTSTKSLICQIDANCSPLQSLNMPLFHIRLECL